MLAIYSFIFPLIATADENLVVATPVLLEDSSTENEFLVASSSLPTPTVQGLVAQAFPTAPVMVRIAKAESSFVPTARNQGSTATGVFQILSGTWKAYGCTGSRTNAADNIACAKKLYEDSGTTPWNSSSLKWQ